MTPTELTIAAQKGDAEAFAALMELHQSQLYRIAYAYLHNEGDASKRFRNQRSGRSVNSKN